MLMMGPQLQTAIAGNAAALSARTTPAALNPTESYFADIPGGTFQMGSTRFKAEQPDHAVTLSDYRMGRTPVTVGAYQKFGEALGRDRFFLLGLSPWPVLLAQGSSKKKLENIPVGSLMQGGGLSAFPSLRMVEITMPLLSEAFSDDNHPMVEVNWFEAVTYALWHGARLATEAEYEYAARGGRNYEYGTATGELSPELARYDSDSPIAVGSFPANPFGVYDLAGNVWEWGMDWYGPYPAGSATDPTGPATGDCRVLRGGSFRSHAWFARAANRSYVPPVLRYSFVGFRCAR